jgi:hypothetical protein
MTGQFPPLWSASELDDPRIPAADLPALTTIARWSRDFLCQSHTELGRQGPVCPYTTPSLNRGLFRLSVHRDDEDLPRYLEHLRDAHRQESETLSERESELLTYLVVLPDHDPVDSARLDRAQSLAKPSFLELGMMIGQFHPACPEPGLWNADFRPLQSPVPLIAIRRLLPFDLPFMGDPAHLDTFLTHFAPALPTRVREQLVSHVHE